MTSYPIDTILPELKKAVQSGPSVIVHAPPGAGKTTRVPLALLDVIPQEQGRIIMLEPRRIAAVSAARWMARTLGEEAGGTVGYAIRFDSRSSARTRIEVVTEGILTRRIQADPGLLLQLMRRKIAICAGIGYYNVRYSMAEKWMPALVRKK